MIRFLWLALFAGEDQLTVYELLAPATHKFAITYDVSTAEEGARYYLNPIRKGSVASDEEVFDLATGAALRWEIVEGQGPGQQFLKVHLAAPVPRGGVTRMRIRKTYLDAASYSTEGDGIVFERSLTIRRNVVVLPQGYELAGSATPAIVSTQADGRIRLSFLNDREDTLLVKIRARKAGVQ